MHCRTEVGDFLFLFKYTSGVVFSLWILGVSLFSALLKASGFLAAEPSASYTIFQVV